nr:MAG TPA: hypothetical protein [Caudoviricetes sp.]
MVAQLVFKFMIRVPHKFFLYLSFHMSFLLST